MDFALEAFTRAAFLLKDTLLICLEEANYRAMSRLTREDPITTVIINSDVKPDRLTGRHRTFLPDVALDRFTKEQILTHLMCDDSFVWSHRLFEWLFNEIIDISTTQELIVSLYGIQRITIANFEDEGRLTRITAHTLRKVKLRDGREYALDLTGAQYGWFDPVMPWEAFEQGRMTHIIQNVPHGYCRDDIIKTCRHEPIVLAHASWLSLIALKFEARMEGYMRRNGDAKKCILSLPQDQFEVKKREFLAAVTESVRLAVRENDWRWRDICKEAGVIT